MRLLYTTVSYCQSYRILHLLLLKKDHWCLILFRGGCGSRRSQRLTPVAWLRGRRLWFCGSFVLGFDSAGSSGMHPSARSMFESVIVLGESIMCCPRSTFWQQPYGHPRVYVVGPFKVIGWWALVYPVGHTWVFSSLLLDFVHHWMEFNWDQSIVFPHSIVHIL